MSDKESYSKRKEMTLRMRKAFIKAIEEQVGIVSNKIVDNGPTPGYDLYDIIYTCAYNDGDEYKIYKISYIFKRWFDYRNAMLHVKQKSDETGINLDI